MTRERSRPVGNDQLSTLFRRIRDEAGISSGSEAARRAGITQATVSRWESGRHVPTAEQAAGYARALGARPDLSRELVDLITDLRTNHDAGRPGPRGGIAFQNRVQRIEAAAVEVAVFHPLLVPGALQTAAYVRRCSRPGTWTTTRSRVIRRRDCGGVRCSPIRTDGSRS